VEADEVIRRYRKWAIMHAEVGDSRKANYAFGKLIALKDKLFEAGPEQARIVMRMLDDDNVHVRFNAAFDTLSIDPEVALPVLREIAAGERGVSRLSAEHTLEQWRDGTLKLPYRKRPATAKPAAGATDDDA
jgi:hypothetical protein